MLAASGRACSPNVEPSRGTKIDRYISSSGLQSFGPALVRDWAERTAHAELGQASCRTGDGAPSTVLGRRSAQTTRRNRSGLPYPPCASRQFRTPAGPNGHSARPVIGGLRRNDQPRAQRSAVTRHAEADSWGSRRDGTRLANREGLAACEAYPLFQ